MYAEKRSSVNAAGMGRWFSLLCISTLDNRLDGSPIYTYPSSHEARNRITNQLHLLRLAVQSYIPRVIRSGSIPPLSKPPLLASCPIYQGKPSAPPRILGLLSTLLFCF
ncbi:hypothetical protein V8C26DRAFT_139651 [Trichoderma gracile]